MDLTLNEMSDLEVWSGDQQYQYHLGTCWNYRLSGSVADLWWNQNLHLDKCSGLPMIVL